MIRSITVNYGAKDFFGQYDFRSETWEGEIDKAKIRKVLKAVQTKGFYAHFSREDGTSECVYVEGSDTENGLLTHVHSDRWNSKDAPAKVKVADFRKAMDAEVAEH